jgi:hypothetical protein
MQPENPPTSVEGDHLARSPTPGNTFLIGESRGIVMKLSYSKSRKGGSMKPNPYKALATTVGIHFFIMLALIYVGVAAFDHIYLNLNRFYMAVVMVAPTVLLMRHMYQNKELNYAIYAVRVCTDRLA